MAGVVDLLSGYPEFVVARALDVRLGWPAKFKFCPSIAEMREWLEAEMRPHRYAREWEAGAREQLLPAPPAPPKPTMPELKARYGENWGLTPDERVNKPKVYSLGELAAKYGVPREAVEAVPDLK
jgi:hypothetical protein